MLDFRFNFFKIKSPDFQYNMHWISSRKCETNTLQIEILTLKISMLFVMISSLYEKQISYFTSIIVPSSLWFFILAPIASALCNKWGCRTIGILGSIIASVSVATSTLAPNIYVMWLLFGLIGGIGMGFIYLSTMIMVGHYFEKKRAIAMGTNNYTQLICINVLLPIIVGIATAGSGIGTITFGPLSHILFDRFGWRGGVLILAGILLSCSLWCALMRPVKPVRKRIISPMCERHVLSFLLSFYIDLTLFYCRIDDSALIKGVSLIKLEVRQHREYTCRITFPQLPRQSEIERNTALIVMALLDAYILSLKKLNLSIKIYNIHSENVH